MKFVKTETKIKILAVAIFVLAAAFAVHGKGKGKLIGWAIGGAGPIGLSLPRIFKRK